MDNIKKAWHGLATFFEYGDLVPFAIIISVFHYYKALGDTGEGVVAIPVAILIDLLHFRTVRYAVRTRTASAVFIGILTTGMAVFYHYEFYSMSITSTVEIIMHALPIPVGIAILAWLNESASKEDELTMSQREAAVNRRESAVNEKRDSVKVRELAMNEREPEMNRREDGVAGREDAIAARESDILAREEAAAMYESGIAKMNPISRDILAMMAGREDTQKAIAERYSVSAGYVHGVKSKMNGSGK